ncbi:MAG: hypothetical protein IPJ75_15025 [Ignavibacteriales bacterium]|nr:hypothetical protein [Ignavibacteriales bacterium]
MVKGLDKFKDYFSDYAQHYTISGGTACFWNLRQRTRFRATQDIDILIILENYDINFNRHLWKFFKDGKYGNLQKELTEQKFYRFLNPGDNEFPKQVEILCRKPEAINLPEGIAVTAIDPQEYFSHLSAIILDNDYYDFTVGNSYTLNGLHISRIETLICLKAYAYLNLSYRKEQGEDIDEKNINKHKRDVFRLGAGLRETGIILPLKIRSDLKGSWKRWKRKPEVAGLLKLMGINNLTREDILSNIRTSFGLET